MQCFGTASLVASYQQCCTSTTPSMFLHARQARARPNGPSISDLIIPALAHAVFVQCHKRCLSCNRSPFSPAKALIRTWIHKAIAHKRRFKHRFARHFVNLCLCAAPLCAVSFACSLSCVQSTEPLSCQCEHGSDPPTLAPHGFKWIKVLPDSGKTLSSWLHDNSSWL